jgi:hypothetical protein
MVSISKQNDVNPSSIRLVRRKSLSFGDCENIMIEDSFAVLTILICLPIYYALYGNVVPIQKTFGFEIGIKASNMPVWPVAHRKTSFKEQNI